MRPKPTERKKLPNSSVSPGLVAAAEADTRWADAADGIDQYLDTAFELYLAGDTKAAYDSVNNAYFKVYVNVETGVIEQYEFNSGLGGEG